MTKEKWIKIGKGALVAMAGALAAYIPEAIGLIDWGTWMPFAQATGAVIANALRVWAQK